MLGQLFGWLIGWFSALLVGFPEILCLTLYSIMYNLLRLLQIVAEARLLGKVDHTPGLVNTDMRGGWLLVGFL